MDVRYGEVLVVSGVRRCCRRLMLVRSLRVGPDAQAAKRDAGWVKYLIEVSALVFVLQCMLQLK